MPLDYQSYIDGTREWLEARELRKKADAKQRAVRMAIAGLSINDCLDVESHAIVILDGIGCIIQTGERGEIIGVQQTPVLRDQLDDNALEAIQDVLAKHKAGTLSMVDATVAIQHAVCKW